MSLVLQLFFLSFLSYERTRKETIGTSSPKDRLDGQVLCPSQMVWENENTETGKKTPEGNLPFLSRISSNLQRRH
jgi:hypothetical protein